MEMISSLPVRDAGRVGDDVPLPASMARAYGFVAITTAYRPAEMFLAERVMADMRRGGIPAAYVRAEYGLEVWRTVDGMRFNQGNE